MAIVAANTVGRRADRIESLLSARLFVEPQLADDRITFVSNLSGHLSLYAMDASGGVPEPLLPPQMALQNPDLVGGELFHVLPGLGLILVMIDADGDENYVPHVIPLEGGFPERWRPRRSRAVARTWSRSTTMPRSPSSRSSRGKSPWSARCVSTSRRGPPR